MLSQQQIEQFHHDGFILIKGAFSESDMETFRRVASVFPTEPRCSRSLHQLTEIASLWSDDRILGPVRQLLGNALVYFFESNLQRQLFAPGEHVTGRHLHHDAKGTVENIFNRVNHALAFTYPVVRVAIYLQDTKTQSGGLKVAPGSHRIDVSSFKDIKLPLYNVKSEPGDIVIFTHRLLHSPYALRLKDNPGVALAPAQEDQLFASAPYRFLPMPTVRETIFIDYGAAHELTDLFVKNRAITDNLMPGVLPSGLSEYLVDRGILNNPGDAAISLRFDKALVETVEAIGQSIADKNFPAEDALLRRLALLHAGHRENSPYYPWSDGTIAGTTAEDGRRLFGQLQQRLAGYRAMWSNRKQDPHMQAYDEESLKRMAAEGQDRTASTSPAPPTADSAAPYNAARWRDFHAVRKLAFPTRKLLKEDTRFFTMGSCFAMQIRRAMAARGLAVYPNYAAVPYDRATEVFDKIPEREALQHYDTFSMRQEFETAMNLWPDRAAGFWPVENARINTMLNAPQVFQDPYRKLVYATTRPALEALSERVSHSIREGLDLCDIVVLTLGLTEVWQHNETGYYLCKPPTSGYGGGKDKATFRQSTFLENYTNMRRSLDLLFARYPSKQVIISVSPVALGETYSSFDVGTANTESKSILRAVAGQICREYENVMYFPSYEMATVLGELVYAEDGRHVRQDFADKIVASFIEAIS